MRLLTMFCFLAVTITATSTFATPIAGIDRTGTLLPVGTLLRFDSDDPANATIVGQTGLTGVGAMDYHGGQLWVAADRDGLLAFYTVDLTTADAFLFSTTSEPSPSNKIFGGSFDMDGRFWVSDGNLRTITAFNPLTGQALSSFDFDSTVGGVGGLAFIGDELYAQTVQTVGSLQRGFGIFDTQSGAFTTITSPGACHGGSMGLDHDSLGGALFYTCSRGSASGPDSVLGAIDPATGASYDIGDVVPSAALDAIAVIPEPSTAVLVSIGLLGLGAKKPRSFFAAGR